MYISNKRFLIITALFLLVPISVQWQLLLLGTKTKAEVVGHSRSSRNGVETLRFTVLQYKVDNQVYETTGPEFVNYPEDKEIWVFYKPGHPEKVLLFTLSGLLLSNKMIVPLVILILWFAFYFSTRKAQRKSALKRRFRLD